MSGAKEPLNKTADARRKTELPNEGRGLMPAGGLSFRTKVALGFVPGLVVLLFTMVLTYLLVDSIIALGFVVWGLARLGLHDPCPWILLGRVVIQNAFGLVDRVQSWTRVFGAAALATGHTVWLNFGPEDVCPDTAFKTASLVLTWVLVIPELWAYGGRHQLRKAETAFLEETGLKNWTRGYAAGVSYIEVAPKDPKAAHKTILFLPGFAHGKAVWGFTQQKLQESSNCRLLALDPPGSGLSYPYYTFWRTAEGCEKWHSQIIDGFITEMGLENVTMIGHSMGAYFSGVYALRYPKKVAHAILVSPAGVPDEQTFSRPRSFLFRFIATFVWGYVTPQCIYRLSGPFGVWMARTFYIERRYIARGQKQIDVSWDTYAKYLAAYNAMPRSYENILYAVLRPFVLPYMPLKARLSDHNDFRLDFIYGQRDWMTISTAQTVCKSLNKMSELISRCETCANCSHQIPMENPSGMSEIVSRLVNTNDGNYPGCPRRRTATEDTAAGKYVLKSKKQAAMI